MAESKSKTGGSTAPAYPPAQFTSDEGGVQRIHGSIDYTSIGVEKYMQTPFPTLLDMIHIIAGDGTKFAPQEGQVVGRMTSPVAPPPLSYEVDLPMRPSASSINVAGDDGQGVQIFYLVVASSINGFSHLVQLDQDADFKSFLPDPRSGHIESGSLLVYAPDDQQGFPGGFGDDGILFTEDDPIVGLPQGYTIVRFGPDGFTFDRTQDAEMNVLEEADDVSFDFTEQGKVEAFNSLIDVLAERYSFTDFRHIDWEAKRAEYLPQIEAAEKLAAENSLEGLVDYGLALHRMTQSVRDAHVAIGFNGPGQIGNSVIKKRSEPIDFNVGANTVELDDGRIIVTDVLDGSPAAAAGLVFGTQIVSVDGAPVEERLPSVIYNMSTGTEEGQRLRQVNNLLKFPAGNGDVTIEAILPGKETAESFTLTPNAYILPDRLYPSINRRGSMPIEYDLATDYAYLSWDSFGEPRVRMGVHENFLSAVNKSPTIKGIIIDMRGNTGGWDTLYFTMASYFFNEEKPLSMHWIDQDVFDGEEGTLVREVPDSFYISAPRPELYYGGPIVILSDQNGASSCEFFTQVLQVNGRATVVGQYASKGAGAPITSVDMPQGFYIHFTKGRAYFAGTEEFNLEAKGVIPDVLVPVTEETERTKIEGGDPVLDAGLALLRERVAQEFIDSLHWVPLPAEQTPGFTAEIPEGWSQPSPPVMQFQSPDMRNGVYYELVHDSTLEAALAKSPVKDPVADLVESQELNGLKWSTYRTVANANFLYFYSFAQSGDDVATVVALMPIENEELGKTAIMEPAIKGFKVGGQ